MKLTKKQLKKIIQEEINEITKDQARAQWGKPQPVKTSAYVQGLLSKGDSPFEFEVDRDRTEVESSADHNVLLIARALQGIYTDASPDTRYEVAKIMLDIADNHLRR
tara:strand:+ start:506 stop:826 length:321 start_codon:yes stop_codon:yes gene_type:complete